MNKKVLIIDDDPSICLLLKKYLNQKDFEAYDAQNGHNALEFLSKKEVDVILCDFRLPDEDGIELLKKFKEINPEAIVIIITGYSHVKIAVKAIKMGAYDYVAKPLYPEEIINTINKALAERQFGNEMQANEKEAFLSFEESELNYLQAQIKLVAPTDLTVMISGETGTGKEYLARNIHKFSKRSEHPFIAVDCGALPNELAGSELFGHEKGAFTGAIKSKEGSFEIADGGTLFLDEIGNLSYEIQVMLLRVLQERVIHRIGGTQNIHVDVRIITATNENLKKLVEEGKFREDLYHRINEFSFFIPPLRERKADILRHSNNFLKNSNLELNKSVQGFAEDAEDALISYPWYGNLRELKNVIKRSVLLTSNNKIQVSDLPGEIKVTFQNESVPELEDATDLKKVSEDAEKLRIINALEETNYNKSKAATLLNIDRKTLYNKIKSYRIPKAR